jgi:hypothetical protein
VCHAAVPFEEDDKDPSIWFLDHSYLEIMFRMFKKVNGEQEQQQYGDTYMVGFIARACFCMFKKVR